MKKIFMLLMTFVFGSTAVVFGNDDEFMLGDGADGGMGLQSFFSQVITGGEIELPQDVDLQIISANDPEKFLVYHKGAVAIEKMRKFTDGNIVSTTYAILPVVVAVSKDCPVDNISIENLRKIYSGRITNWSQLNGPDQKIRIAGPEMNSPAGRAFRSLVMTQDIFSAKPPVPGTDILPDMLVVRDHAGEVALLENMPGVIVFGGWKLANDCNGRYKLLEVDSVQVTVNSIMKKSYPLVVEHALIYSGDSVPVRFYDVLDFLMKSAQADGDFLSPATKK